MDETELEYYRQIEDLFVALRGVPHVLSPKDFQLMRSWWREGVALAAVSAGLTEVFARRQDRDDDPHVVSLGYCRHAVRASAKRMASMRVGEDAAGNGAETASPGAGSQAVIALADQLHHRARAMETETPGLAAVVTRVARLVESAQDLDPVGREEHLFALEGLLLDGCWDELTDTQRLEIGSRADDAAASGATEDARSRAWAAARDREVRHLHDLPRLEVDS